MIYFIIILINDKVKHITDFLNNRNYGIYFLMEKRGGGEGRLCIHISLTLYTQTKNELYYEKEGKLLSGENH